MKKAFNEIVVVFFAYFEHLAHNNDRHQIMFLAMVKRAKDSFIIIIIILPYANEINIFHKIEAKNLFDAKFQWNSIFFFLFAHEIYQFNLLS